MGDKNEVVLTDPRVEAGTWVLIGTAFVAGGVLAIMFAGGLTRFAGFLAVAMFGFVLVLGIIQLIKPDQLILTDEGFERRSYPFSADGRFLRWDEVSEFEVGAGGRTGPSVSYMEQKEGVEPSYASYRQLKTMGMDAFELAGMMNKRRRLGRGETQRKASKEKEIPKEVVVPTVVGRDIVDLEFERSQTGRAPAVTGSFICIARSFYSASTIAERLGEELVSGTVDGKQVEGVVALIARVGPLVFAKGDRRTRIYMKATADRAEAYDMARTMTQGRLRRVKPGTR